MDESVTRYEERDPVLAKRRHRETSFRDRIAGKLFRGQMSTRGTRLVLVGKADSLAEAVHQAATAIDDGAANAKLETLRDQ